MPVFLLKVCIYVLLQGDNAVLIQKVAKELLAGIQKNTVSYPSDLCWNGDFDQKSLLVLMTMREMALGRLVAKNMSTGMSSGKTLFQCWMGEESDNIQMLGKSFGERICASAFYDAVKKESGATLGLVYDLFCMGTIFNNLASYQLLKLLTVDQANHLVELYHTKIKIVASFSLQLVDYLGLDPSIIRAPIAGNWAEYNTWDNQGELIKPNL